MFLLLSITEDGHGEAATELLKAKHDEEKVLEKQTVSPRTLLINHPTLLTDSAAFRIILPAGEETCPDLNPNVEVEVC